MATSTYITGRKKYQRPQALLWADNSGKLENGLYIPNGLEINANPGSETNPDNLNQFLILSDDNRSPIDFGYERIEKRERTINGRMRSYHIADKLKLNFSYTNLPSRAFALPPDFDANGKSEFSGQKGLPSAADAEYTTDGGAGGVELLDWYENHQGSFWCYLAYDKYSVFGKDDSAYGHLPQYNQLIEVFFSDFSYSVTKRGGSNFDFWNISVSLEEA
jgi:hypothetical protein